jgi:dUTP pyrophosphatase
MCTSIGYTLDEGAVAPQRHYEGDAGWDLYGLHDVVILPNRFEKIHTGVHVAPWPSTWLLLTGRSSSLARGLLVISTIIDQGYRGELFVSALNIGRNRVKIAEGERIAQLIPFQHVPVEWHHLTVLPGSERGTDGVGSTGR